MRVFVLLIISTLVAICFGQLPEFAQQYSQRLGGAVDELERIVGRFDEDARRAGTDRDGAVFRLSRSDDLLVRDQGIGMSATIARLDRFETLQRALNHPGIFQKTSALAFGYDADVGSRTWLNYRYGIQFTADAMLLMSASFVASFLTLASLLTSIEKLRRVSRRLSA